MRRSLLVGLLFLVIGCGGDGGGTGSSRVLQGTYRGTATLAAFAGPAAQGTSGPIAILVSGSVVQVGQFPPTTLNGNQFSTSVPFTAFNNRPGSSLRCTAGTFGVAGTFSGATVAGPIASDGLVCNGVPVTLTGSFTATLQAGQLPRGGHEADLMETARGAVRRAVP